MKVLADSSHALADGLAVIRKQFKVPEGFPPEVLAAAQEASGRAPARHADRTDLPFVTLDPATSTDLDQAFTIEKSGGDLLLRYAIADVAWFVEDGDAIDQEAWKRGETLYLPDGRAPLYPPVLGEHAASLLPDGPRPAVIFTVRVAEDGAVRLDGAERAVIRSRAKLAYENVRAEDLPAGFAEFAQRMSRNETRRGASRVDPPEQEVEKTADGRFRLIFRPRLKSEEQNATLSLATNMAIADAMLAHHTGLFRTMAEPNAAGVMRLRRAAKAFGLDWPASVGLHDYQRTLSAADPREAALMLEIRRESPGASYMPYTEGVRPWHAALAATYAHATAPLRRLPDRYVVRATLAICNGQAVPDAVTDAFARLPKVMARADGHAAQLNGAVISLAEAVMLAGREGEMFDAVVTGIVEKGAQVQLADLPIMVNVATPKPPAEGDRLKVRLVLSDPGERRTVFAPAEAG